MTRTMCFPLADSSNLEQEFLLFPLLASSTLRTKNLGGGRGHTAICEIGLRCWVMYLQLSGVGDPCVGLSLW